MSEKVIITDEVRKVLAGMTPMNEGDGIPFTPQEFAMLPEEVRPVFFIRPLSNEEAKEVRQHLHDIVVIAQGRKTKDKDAQETYDKAKERYKESFGIEITKKCITDWKNVYNLKTSEPIPFSSMGENLIIPDMLLASIFTEICCITGITPRNKTVVQDAIAEEIIKKSLDDGNGGAVA